MATLDDLVEALYGPASGDEPVRATSLRLSKRVHRATSIATELGMDESFTAATTAALLDRLRGFLRQRAIAEHLTAFPQDQPRLAAVANRRVHGTNHPAAAHPKTVAEVADWFEHRHPDWATSGQVDEAVDRVLEHVELVLEREGGRSRAATA